MSYSELGRFALEPSHPSFEALEQINAAAQRAAALTRQLLIFARKELVDPKVIDVNRLVESVAKLLHRVVGEDVILSIDLCSGSAPVMIDPVQCEQLLMNLAVNARDAMPAGGSLSIRTTIEAATVRVTVHDTGLGMPEAVQVRAFEPFFTTKGPGKGTGLGLSTCLAIVRNAGGTIAIESDRRQGHGFPRRAAARRERRRERSTGAPVFDAARRRDRALDRRTTPWCASSLPASCAVKATKSWVATQANEALELAADHSTRIDLFLSDVVMPGESGPSVIERLSAVRPSAKVLFVSGYPGDDISRPRRRRGQLPDSWPNPTRANNSRAAYAKCWTIDGGRPRFTPRVFRPAQPAAARSPSPAQASSRFGWSGVRAAAGCADPKLGRPKTARATRSTSGRSPTRRSPG